MIKKEDEEKYDKNLQDDIKKLLDSLDRIASKRLGVSPGVDDLSFLYGLIILLSAISLMMGKHFEFEKISAEGEIVDLMVKIVDGGPYLLTVLTWMLATHFSSWYLDAKPEEKWIM